MSVWENEITKPFANTGDKKDINLEESPDNSISYEKGFTSNYEVQENDGEIVPSKYNIDRKVINQLFYKIFSAIQELQTKSSYKNGYNKADMARQSTISDLIPGGFSIGSTVDGEKIVDLNSRTYLFSGYHKIDIYNANFLEFTYKNLPKEFEEKYNSGFLQVYTLQEDIFAYPQIKNNHINTYYIQQNLFPTGKIEDLRKFLYSIPNTLSYYSRILCVEYTNDGSDGGVGSIVVKEESSIDWKKVTLSQEDIEEIKLSLDNVKVSATTTLESSNNILVEENNTIKKINKNELDKVYALSTHTHNISNIDNLENTLNTKSDINHTHVMEDITDLNINSEINPIYINEDNPITSLDELINNGYYMVSKQLQNIPEGVKIPYFLKVNSFYITNEYGEFKNTLQNIYITFFTDNIYYTRGVITQDNIEIGDGWSSWEYKKIQQDKIDSIDLSLDNIKVSQDGSYSSCTTFNMVDSNNKIVKIDKSKIKIENTQVNNLGKLAEKDKANLTTDVEGVLPIANGGNGNNKGLSQGIKHNTLITENDWITSNESGTHTMFWQTGDYASLKLPYTAGALIRNCFTNSLKSAIALQYGECNAALFDFSTEKWRQLAFKDETTITTYTTSDGQWTETLLSTGEIMLEGWGKANKPNTTNSVYVSLPKNIDTNKSYYIDGKVEVKDGITEWGALKVARYIKGFIILYPNITDDVNIFWEFKGILA